MILYLTVIFVFWPEYFITIIIIDVVIVYFLLLIIIIRHAE